MYIMRGEDAPLRGKGKGVLSPYDHAFGNVCCGDQAFPLLLIEVFHPDSETFLRVLERIKAMKELTGWRLEFSSRIGRRILSRVDQPEAVEDFPCPFFAHEPSRVFRQQQRVKFWDTQSRVLPAQPGEGRSEIRIRR